MISPRRALASLSVLALGVVSVALVGPAASAATASATDTPASVMSIDGNSFTRGLPIATQGIVDDVTVTVDFAVASYVCGDEADGASAFNYDVALRLASPSGTTVELVRSTGTSTGSTYNTGPAARAQVTFDDDAAAAVGSTGPTPVSGTFRPVQSLTAFDGESAAGTWTVVVVDTVSSSPSCYYGSTVNVDVLEIPVLADASLADGTLGEGYTQALSLAPNSVDADSFAVTDGELPNGLTLSNSGAISGTPTESGDFTFSVAGTNANGTGTAVEYSIRVGAPASLTGPVTATAQAGEAFTYAPTFDAGFPAASVTVSAGALPDGLTLDGATGEISGTTADALGEYPVTLTADSGYGTPATLSVAISLVAGPVDSITLDPATAGVDEGDSVTYTVTAADSVGNPVTLADGDVVLTSDVASDVVVGLTVTFPESATTHTITASHSASGATATASVDVEPLVPATLTGPDAASATAGEAFTYTPTFEPGYPAASEVTLVEGELPEGLSLDAATGVVSGTATVAGDYAITLGADNGVGDAAELDVVISVAAAPVDSITLDPSTAAVDEGDSVTFTVGAQDEFGNEVTLADGDVVLTSDVASDVVAGLTVSFPESATTHTITATHTASGVAATASVDVEPLVPATLTGPETASATAGEELTYTPTFDAGYPAATEVTLVDGELPEGLTLDAATGVVSGTATVAGEYAITLGADNGVGEPATLDVVLTIAAAQVDAFTITPSATSVDEGGSVTITANGTDEFGNPVVIAPGDVTLSSDVSTDVIDGMEVTFPSASPHTITATYTPTGASASVVIEVVPAPVEDTDDVTDEDDLADTGVNPGTVAQATAASALALLGAALVIARRRTVRS